LNTSLYYLRNTGFWLTKARSTVTRVLRECKVCLKYRAQSFQTPNSPSLPASRTEAFKPFSCTAVDYTGNFKVKDLSGKVIKAYILLFTCMTTRAVHLELVPSMSVAEFLNAFVRFSNRYGLPSEVYSDNAKTFLTAANLLKDIVEHNIVTDFFNNRNILFKTIPIYSPNQGGAWERLIGLVKNVIFKAYGRAIYSYDEFITILSDAQNVINNRPLFYNESTQDIDVVSPNMLLSGGQHFPLIKFSDKNLENIYDKANDATFLQNVNQIIKDRDEINHSFLNEWLSAYILDLRNKHGISKTINEENLNRWLKVGSVCLFKTPVSVDHYPLVIIVKLLPARDGSVRNVEVKNANGQHFIVNIGRLSPLEILTQSDTSLDVAHDVPGPSEPTDDLAPNDAPKRPLREAAARAQQLNKSAAMLGLT